MSNTARAAGNRPLDGFKVTEKDDLAVRFLLACVHTLRDEAISASGKEEDRAKRRTARDLLDRFGIDPATVRRSARSPLGDRDVLVAVAAGLSAEEIAGGVDMAAVEALAVLRGWRLPERGAVAEPVGVTHGHLTRE